MRHRPAEESLAAALRHLLQTLPGLVSDRVELLSLELTRSKQAFGRIAAMAMALSIFAATAWLTLWGALIVGLVALGLPPWAAMVLALLANALAAFAAALWMRRLLPLLSLPATRRHLRFGTGAGADDGTDERALKQVDPHPLDPTPEMQIPPRP